MCCLRRSENGCLLMQVAGWDQCISYMHHLQNMSCSLEQLWTLKDIQVLQFECLATSGTNLYCKGVWISESRKILLLGFGIWNAAQGIWNSNNNYWNPESSTWNPESMAWSPESKTVT